MDQDVANIMLEHLKHLRKGQDAMREDIHDLKVRTSAIEQGIGVIHNRIDRVEVRLERIEKRLDLVNA